MSEQTDGQKHTLPITRGRASAGVTWAALNRQSPGPHSPLLPAWSPLPPSVPPPDSPAWCRWGASFSSLCMLNQIWGWGRWRNEDTPPSLRLVPSSGGRDSGGEKAGSWTAEIKALSAPGRARGRAGSRQWASLCLSNWQLASHGINDSLDRGKGGGSELGVRVMAWAVQEGGGRKGLQVHQAGSPDQPASLRGWG